MIAANNTRNSKTGTNNRLGKYLVITPAVSIDRSHQNNFTTTTLMPSTSAHSNGRSWEWCSLWCSAIKCFNVYSDRTASSRHHSVPIGARAYQQNDNHFIRIDLPRKYHDKNCNITYELWRIQILANWVYRIELFQKFFFLNFFLSTRYTFTKSYNCI